MSPNRLTRIPEGAPPPPRGWIRALVPLGDAFMLVMLSRPSSGSLRDTWITPATLWMSAVTGPACLLLALAAATAAVAGHAMVWWIGAAAALLLGAGSLSVAALGLDQLRAQRRSPR